jgi:hypothetical protein
MNILVLREKISCPEDLFVVEPDGEHEVMCGLFPMKLISYLACAALLSGMSLTPSHGQAAAGGSGATSGTMNQ